MKVFLILKTELPSELAAKANELQTKAEALKIAPGLSGAGEASAAAGTLEGKAGTLYTAATQLPSEDKLEELQPQATELAKAAGKQDDTGADTSLYKKANELSKNQNDPTKAIAVIKAFNTVKAAYETLSTEEKYSTNKPQPQETPVSQEQRKVQAVDNAWNGVNDEFQILCKALFKQYATDLETQATQLKNDPTVENAQQFKTAYDEFKDVKSTIRITEDTARNTKNITITNLPHINDTFKPRQKKFGWIIIPSMFTMWSDFLTYVLLLVKLAVYPQKLKAEATNLSTQAGTLSTHAGTLETKLLGSDDEKDAKKLAEGLKEAASNSSPNDKGLKQLLGELHNASEFSQIFERAQLVLAKYNEVVNAYNSVAADTTATGKAGEFSKVKEAFTALQKEFNKVYTRDNAGNSKLWKSLGNSIDLLQKLLFDGHQVRALIDAKHYDIQNTNVPSGLQTKARELQGKADQLKTKADSTGSGAVTTTAGELAAKAQELHDAANALETAATTDTALNPLETAAGDLKKKARDTSSSGLYGAANELATQESGLEGKATEVIEKFEQVESRYKALINQADTSNLTGDPKVTAVTTEYTNLKNVYDQMLNLTKLKNNAETLKTEAETSSAPALTEPANLLVSKITDLRDGTGSGTDHDNAKTVISQFETVKDKFNALNDEQNKKKVKNEFDALNSVYTHIGSTTFLDLLIPNLNNNS